MKKRKTFFIVIILSLLLTGLFGCAKKPLEPQLVLKKSSFHDLPGWQQDDQEKVLDVLQKSCVVIKKLDPNKPFHDRITQYGKVQDWQTICFALDGFKQKDAKSARKFFEFWFRPYRIFDNYNPKGLFTGYYLPKLNCSLLPSKSYNVPIYALPDDWVRVDLGLFHPEFKGRSVVGRVKNRRLIPYPSRKEIVRGVIKKKAKVLAWCDDKVDVAFAHIQGSALVELPNKKRFLINYEGSNGRSYTSIGKILVKNKALQLENSSMQDIRAWFLSNPKKVDEILDKNSSYVFFKILKNKDPFGSQQVPLTPGRSLAVDRRYIQLGMPIWLETSIPNCFSKETEDILPFRNLLIAQDTGGAIKGVVRGDVYWGSGKNAAFVAGHMKSPGGYWILLPRKK